ncbi:DUF4387 domain-containing protein [Streptomyces sp. NPDC055036]
MTTLLDYCSLVRSKNAGPFTLTFDFMCHDQEAYDALIATGFLNKSLFAGLYGAAPEQILLVSHPLALAVKVSLPRPTVQGDLHDTDCYAGQQYAPLMEMEVAGPRGCSPGSARACCENSAVRPQGGARGVRCVRSQGGGSSS